MATQWPSGWGLGNRLPPVQRDRADVVTVRPVTAGWSPFRCWIVPTTLLPMPTRVALLTAGGYAPCLSSAVGALIETYDATDPGIELVAYRHGYHGLLTGNSVVIGPEERAGAALLHRYGGSPIGNSRVKLTNDDDCRRRGLIGEGETALQVAAARLQADGVDVLHTIGGDDTNTAAADLAAYLRTQGS